jgi:hypothetical protein
MNYIDTVLFVCFDEENARLLEKELNTTNR